MVQDVLRAIGGIGAYGAISIILFFAVFTGAVVWAMGLKKSHTDAMSALPLRDDSTSETTGGTSHE